MLIVFHYFFYAFLVCDGREGPPPPRDPVFARISFTGNETENPIRGHWFWDEIDYDLVIPSNKFLVNKNDWTVRINSGVASKAEIEEDDDLVNVIATWKKQQQIEREIKNGNKKNNKNRNKSKRKNNGKRSKRKQKTADITVSEHLKRQSQKYGGKRFNKQYLNGKKLVSHPTVKLHYSWVHEWDALPIFYGPNWAQSVPLYMIAYIFVMFDHWDKTKKLKTTSRQPIPKNLTSIAEKQYKANNEENQKSTAIKNGTLYSNTNSSKNNNNSNENIKDFDENDDEMDEYVEPPKKTRRLNKNGKVTSSHGINHNAQTESYNSDGIYFNSNNKTSRKRKRCNNENNNNNNNNNNDNNNESDDADLPMDLIMAPLMKYNSNENDNNNDGNTPIVSDIDDDDLPPYLQDGTTRTPRSVRQLSDFNVNDPKYRTKTVTEAELVTRINDQAWKKKKQNVNKMVSAFSSFDICFSLLFFVCFSVLLLFVCFSSHFVCFSLLLVCFFLIFSLCVFHYFWCVFLYFRCVFRITVKQESLC